MKYEIRQVTSYTYSSYVPYAAHVLRLAPQSSARLHVLEHKVRIDPAPATERTSTDFFGSPLTHIALTSPHNRFTVDSRSVVRLDATATPDPATTAPWEEVRDEIELSTDLGAGSPVHQVFPTRLVPVNGTLAAFAAHSFTPGRPILEGALELMARITAEFAYDPTATDVMTPVMDAFNRRRGVCQDFAHIMIGALRSLGLAAAYVSGYLRTVPEPGRERLQGADAMHAWVSVWCGARDGWQDLDPTNAMIAGIDHIPLARGRDYSDVSPIDGVIFDWGQHSVAVAVDVLPIDDKTP